MDEHTRDDGAPSPADDRGATPAGLQAREAAHAPPPAAAGEDAAGAHDWQPLRGGMGLSAWLVALVVLGGGGLLFGQEELAGLMAIAGLFAASQAADLDHRWRGLYRLLAWVVPAGGVLMFLAFANVVHDSDLAGARRTAAFATAFAGALISALTLVPAFTRGLCAAIFRTPESSHTLRLATRLIALGLWLSLVAGLAVDAILQPLLADPEPLFARFSPVGQTVGSLALALAAVGYLVRRDLRETLERLGLTAVQPNQIAMVAIGVIALIGLNAGADLIQQWVFPGLWEQDHRINLALAQGITLPQALTVGLMAGIGEEITLRGGLQPKLGLVLTSLLFAVLHIQYSWFGMVVILAFGLILGVIRARTNTTVVVAVHSLYDMIVLVALK